MYTFKSKEECITKSNLKQSNPKYKSFKQFIFTCGDKNDLKIYLIKQRKKNNILLEQSDQNTLASNGDILKLFNLNENLFFKFPLYKSISLEDSFRNSLKYLFFKIKFGIYVQIKQNKLLMFIPFNNQNFKNNWSNLIKLDSNISWSEYIKKKANDINPLALNHKPSGQDLQYNKYINWDSNKSKWEIDNCVLDTRAHRNYKLINASYYYPMLEETLANRKINDVEFFINHRDFPVLKCDYTQPYEQLYNSDLIPLESKYANKHFLPICSMSSSNNFVDIMLPTVDDWEIASQNIHFGMCRDQYINFENKIITNWENKIDKVIFRGATTDCGFNSETSARYLVHKLSELGEIPELDAGITRLWFNDIKLANKTLNYPQRIKTVEPIPFTEMSKYKYILNIDGSVTAFRISAELAFGSVILKVDSKYKIWYLDLLEPFVHYIPIKKDLSDLKEKIEWCKLNQDHCKSIAKAARDFYFKYINKDVMMDYIQETLNLISKNHH